MLKKFSFLFLFCTAFALNAVLVQPVKEIRGIYLQETYTRIGTLPSNLLQAFSLEFQGATADLLFLQTMTFMGYNIGENVLPEQDEWQLIGNTLDRITDLDPRFWDPYVFAEMFIGWQIRDFELVNNLLLKASKARIEDYRPFYYLGFNHFYFQKNATQAAFFLREAAKRPRAPSFIKALASRMSLYGSQTIAGIVFLEEMISETYDLILKQQLKTRLTALQRIHELEKTVLHYRKKHQRLPEKLEDLIREGMIKNIPSDPYGGKFILLKNGKVYTTSDLRVSSEKK
ncbi:hypothetical protein [Desulfogranum marinum]|uniref:hypothetical protein n=1 Tax=Desulfogranum marinum TaxID=453220 RepID=UPI001962C93A|nr:hypothetical protein [Desulfogranum marinum]MBM9513576.1 hypothetical protein [Desulfogranum marinum]